MKEKIEIRLKELYDEYKHVANPNRVWINPIGGLTREERIEKCKILITELEILLDNPSGLSYSILIKFNRIK